LPPTTSRLETKWDYSGRMRRNEKLENRSSESQREKGKVKKY